MSKNLALKSRRPVIVLGFRAVLVSDDRVGSLLLALISGYIKLFFSIFTKCFSNLDSVAWSFANGRKEIQ